MGFYENLIVYRKAQELAVYFENTVRGFDRYHKYTVGTELRNLSRRICVLVALANTKTRRLDALSEALDKLEELKILLRICFEMKAFRSFKSFEYSTKLTVDVAKQCEGWLKSQNSGG
jgi:hypothetical protein